MRNKTNYLNGCVGQSTLSMGNKQDPHMSTWGGGFSEATRKQEKLRQAKTIKDEMSCLGIQNPQSNPEPNQPKSLIGDKSARDLLIKQKVEEKNRKHQDLKSAITKLLSD